MKGVWTPKRAPVAALALSTLPANTRTDFDEQFAAPTIAQRHLWVAAARGESLVVVTPRHSGGSTGLRIASQILRAKNITSEIQCSDAGAGRSLSLIAPGMTLTVLEPRAESRDTAQRLAETRERCGYIDVTKYEAVRTRVFGPFRDDPEPDRESLAPAFAAELERMRADGARVAVLGSDSDPIFPAGAASCLIERDFLHSSRVARLATATDGPEHDEPELVLFARNWLEVLGAHVVADRVRRGEMDTEREGPGEETARAIQKWREEIANDSSPPEHVAYRLVAGLAMNRGHAIAVLNGVRLVTTSRA
ncbi:MAG: hypothetical protein ACJAYU_004679 [Bradymonadia bacterium]|jgi:hypothetical protein